MTLQVTCMIILEVYEEMRQHGTLHDPQRTIEQIRQYNSDLHTRRELPARTPQAGAVFGKE